MFLQMFALAGINESQAHSTGTYPDRERPLPSPQAIRIRGPFLLPGNTYGLAQAT